MPHVSTGELLRAAVSQHTPLGLKARSYMDNGELVPDELVLALLEERLQSADAQRGWILDGFPRNVAQADTLEQVLEQMNQRYDHVLNLEVPVEIIVQRLLRRGRTDDSEAIIRNRLEVYQAQTAPLIQFYQQRNQLHSINGHAPVEAVAASLRQAIGG